MLAKRHIAYPLVFFLLFIGIGIGLLLLASYLLPGMLESKIISILKREAGISAFKVNIRELDLDGADLGPLQIGPQENPTLVIHSIQLDYSPGSLWQKRSTRFRSAGWIFIANMKTGNWVFAIWISSRF